jgi:type III secretion system FlhB-like substrate exporter
LRRALQRLVALKSGIGNKVEKAVAIKYTRDLPAPLVLARGKGRLAERMKAIASDNEISIMEMPELADALIELEVGSFIPERFYEILAEILVFIMNQG